jgi:uncharacterized membrane-anchored protein
MRAPVKRVLIIAATLWVVGSVNWSILAKEHIKSDGELILLALGPVDPRSLMQGDYIALRFEIESQIPTASSGTIALKVAPNRVATVNKEDDTGLHIRYRIRNGRPWIGTNAYFFQEGGAQLFAGARFGEFRVDRDSGEAVLVGLRDQPY